MGGGGGSYGRITNIITPVNITASDALNQFSVTDDSMVLMLYMCVYSRPNPNTKPSPERVIHMYTSIGVFTL